MCVILETLGLYFERFSTRFNIDGLLLPPFLDNSEAISHDQYQTTSDYLTHVKTGQSIEDSGISSADNTTQQQENQQSAKPVLPIIREAHIPKGASRMSEEVQSDYKSFVRKEFYLDLFESRRI